MLLAEMAEAVAMETQENKRPRGTVIHGTRRQHPAAGTLSTAMAIALNRTPLSDVSDVYLVGIAARIRLTQQNMKTETALKRLAYQESVWAVTETELVEEKRKLQLRIGAGGQASMMG